MRGAVEAAREAGVEVIAFGDIFLEDVRRYREESMAGTSIGTIFPLVGACLLGLGLRVGFPAGRVALPRRCREGNVAGASTATITAGEGLRVFSRDSARARPAQGTAAAWFGGCL
jgi:hypothetical protein